MLCHGIYGFNNNVLTEMGQTNTHKKSFSMMPSVWLNQFMELSQQFKFLLLLLMLLPLLKPRSLPPQHHHVIAALLNWRTAGRSPLATFRSR